MGKLESGEVVLESVPFDLPELMHEITDVLEKQAAERGIVLHREYGKAAASTAGGQSAARQAAADECAQQRHRV